MNPGDLDAAKLAADHAYSTWLPWIVRLLGCSAALLAILCGLVVWLGPRFVAAVVAIGAGLRTIGAAQALVVGAAEERAEARHRETMAALAPAELAELLRLVGEVHGIVVSGGRRE